MSFTFALPPAAVVARLQAAGSQVVATVTTVDEARAAEAVGVDALAVQSAAAGGHSGTTTPQTPNRHTDTAALVAAVRSVSGLPLLAAGGISGPAAVRDAMKAGANAVLVGTALLRTPESGARPIHKDALVDPARDGTVVTRAFTGRPARALRNRFTDEHTATAPLGYPAIHLLTVPLRAAATRAADADGINLWAGTGYRHASDEPASDVVRWLAEGTEASRSG